MNKSSPRIAIVGVGHELRGDDAVGVVAVRSLQAAADDNVLVIDAGPAPENFTGRLRDFAPDLLLLVDAVQMNAPPGTIRMIKHDATQPSSATTHTLSLHLLTHYLRSILNCDILLLGIQPGQDVLGTGLSGAVRQSVEDIVHVLGQICE